MKVKKQQALCLLIMVIMLATAQPGLAQASDNAAVSLEQAVSIVKQNFDIPADFKEFKSGYSSYNGNATWTLNWAAGQGAEGSLDAQIDTQTGEVVSVYIWRNSWANTPTAQIPKISKTEAQAKAFQLLRSLASRHLSELQLVEGDDQLLPIGSYGPPTYNIRWQRIVNGVPFPSNGVTIIVRSDDASISSYQLNWDKAPLPDASRAVTLEQAQKAFFEAGMLELAYIRPSRILPPARGENPKILLIYQLAHPSGGVIDALSGKPLESSDRYYNFADGGGADFMSGKAKADESLSPTNVLSDEEIKEIEKTTRLLKQEQAVQAVKKHISIPAEYSLHEASLISPTDSLASHIWSLSWNSREGKMGGNSVYATVNAENGELLSFQSYDPDSENEPGIIDRQAAQALAEKFLRQVQPERFSNTRLLDKDQIPWTITEEKPGSNPSRQHFEYRRMVNQIPYYGNSISVDVNAVKQEVTGFSLNWGNISFPSPDGIISPQAAVDAFLKYRPLTLSYFQEMRYSGPGNIRLVYQPLSNSQPGYGDYTIVDAKNGQLLDWQGNPASQRRVLVFDDIGGSFAAEDISLLGRAGLFGEYGSSFHPDENVTVVSLLRAMLKSTEPEMAGLSDDEVLSQARSRKWLKEDLQAGDGVPREMLAKFMIRYLNLERATHAVGIYQVPYADADSWPGGLLAYAALCNGLGIIQGDGVVFDPFHTVTRAEAASALVRALRVEP